MQSLLSTTSRSGSISFHRPTISSFPSQPTSSCQSVRSSTVSSALDNTSIADDSSYESSFIDDSSIIGDGNSLCSLTSTISQEEISKISPSTSAREVMVERRPKGRPRKNHSQKANDTTTTVKKKAGRPKNKQPKIPLSAPVIKRKPGRPKTNSKTSDLQDQFNTLDNYFSQLSVTHSNCKPSSSKSTSNTEN